MADLTQLESRIKQWEEIERVEKEVGIKILKGIELENGT